MHSKKNNNIYKWIIIGLAVLLIAALIFVIVSCSKKNKNGDGFDLSKEQGKKYSYTNEVDDQGRVVKHTVTSPKGEITGYEEYTYDEKDRRVTVVNRDANGNFKNKYAYIYDDTDYGDNIERIKEQRTLDESNTVIKNTVKEFNANGYETKVSHWEKDVLKDYVEYEYDEAGQLIKMTNYKGNGQLTDYTVYTYDENGIETPTKYDANGNII